MRSWESKKFVVLSFHDRKSKKSEIQVTLWFKLVYCRERCTLHNCRLFLKFWNIYSKPERNLTTLSVLIGSVSNWWFFITDQLLSKSSHGAADNDMPQDSLQGKN